MDERPIIGVLCLDGNGSATQSEWDPSSRIQADGRCWIRLDRFDDRVGPWLADEAGLDERTIEAMLVDVPRPRVEVFGNGILAAFRALNLQEGERPEDMLTLRVWLDSDRLITLQRAGLRSVDDVIASLEANHGPVTLESLLVALIDAITRRMTPLIEGLADRLDELEDTVLDPARQPEDGALLDIRRQVIALHRYLNPQYHALSGLETLTIIKSSVDRSRELHETANRLKRFIEELEAANARAGVIQDEYENQLAGRLNSRMYVLTVIAAIFIPLSFLAGLLGMNVGGMPWSASPYGLATVCVLMALIGVAGFFALRRFGWL